MPRIVGQVFTSTPNCFDAQDVWKFVEENAEELDAAIDYTRDLGYDYFGPFDQ